MSIECSECGRDARAGHDDGCSRTHKLVAHHEVKLLPCPFCGGLAVAYNDGEDCIASCNNDACDVMPSAVSNMTVAAAARAWNKRAGSAYVPEPDTEAVTLLQRWYGEYSGSTVEDHYGQQSLTALDQDTEAFFKRRNISGGGA